MIQDALAGRIDLIITKSVSRFARNTVDTLTAIRKLKEHGVEVYFEEQNIYTLDGKGEVLLTIMSSIAQEESRNISENVTWGMRKRFADGKVTMPYGQFMGYRRGKDGTPEVVEAEAEIVRTIFRRFLEGATPAMISRELNLAGIPCPSRKSLLSENEAEIAKARKKTSRWGTSTVENILANEKYKGDAILQKTYCTDYLLKTFVVNDGSVVPKYYAQNSHPAIVSPEVFDLAQQELAWRRSLNGRYSGRSCFASRVVCGDCGAFYGSKVWHSTDEYRRTIWRCNNKYAGETKSKQRKIMLWRQPLCGAAYSATTGACSVRGKRHWVSPVSFWPDWTEVPSRNAFWSFAHRRRFWWTLWMKKTRRWPFWTYWSTERWKQRNASWHLRQTLSGCPIISRLI